MSEDWTASNLPYLQPFSGTGQEFKELLQKAKEDGHSVFYPTEVVWKNGERVGWFSFNAAPLVWAWMSTKKMKIRDSLQMVNTMEVIARRQGFPGICFPCSKESPFYEYLKKIGYTSAGQFDFFFKPFNRQDLNV